MLPLRCRSDMSGLPLRGATIAWLPGAASLKLERPFEVKKEPYPEGIDISRQAYSHSFSGMTMQYLLFWGMDCGLLLLRERRQGIWKRLKAAPISLPTLLGGKSIATALLALTPALQVDQPPPVLVEGYPQRALHGHRLHQEVAFRAHHVQ